MTAADPSRPAAERILALVAPLTNYERTRSDRPRWSLANIRALLRRPGATRPSAKAVQVGGSKGKGTTALYVAALGRALGLRTGVYLSPHVDDVTERVQVDGRSPAVLVDVVAEVVAFAERAQLPAVSFFEVMTAAAVECFAREGVGLAVYEVGLGGRLDATTAIGVDLSIVTNVELEHTELLGDTEVAIAGEKAHVVRRATPAITGATGDALAVIAARARAVSAPLRVLGHDLVVEAEAVGARGFAGTIVDRGERLPFALPEAAGFELPALAMAVAALRTLHPELGPALGAALTPVRFRPPLPARFERVVRAEGVYFIDAAHTEGSLRATAAEAARAAPGHRFAVLFASAAGKRWQLGLSQLAPIVDTLYVTTLEGTASESPDAICACARGLGLAAHAVADSASGLDALRRHPGPWLVTGSFYLAGQARRLLGVDVRA
ncbi:MAG: hypothetical protein R3F56_11295 [Planctomycetota bacterium]